MSERALNVFISYSHKDKAYKEELETFLVSLIDNKIINPWHDGMIVAGEKWNDEIMLALNSADIILLLISQDFLSSNFCRNIEMTRALERVKTGEACVIPVLIRQSTWQDTDLKELQPLPKDYQYQHVSAWPDKDKDEAYHNIYSGIKEAVEKLAESKKCLLSKESEKISSVIGTKPMVLWVHGTDKLKFPQEPDILLDWTKHFDFYASPRKLPNQATWENEIIPQIREVEKCWAESYGGRVRIYAKSCLSSGVLLGNRFSRTKVDALEVNHYDNTIWYSDQPDKSFKTLTVKTFGKPASSNAVVILNTSNKDIIQTSVQKHLDQMAMDGFDYRVIVNLQPENKPDQFSIKDDRQAVKFALDTKMLIKELETDGIKQIHLFLDTPLSLAFFVGHYLTAISCTIQTYEFASPGYVISCCI